MKIGETYKIDFGKKSANNKTVKILSIIEDQIVIKSWSEQKGFYEYSIEDPFYFNFLKAEGLIKKVKK